MIFSLLILILSDDNLTNGFSLKVSLVDGGANYMDAMMIQITIDEYKNPINRDWRTSAIEIINPKLNNGGFNFKPNVPFGANGIDVITMSEFIMV